MAKKGKRSRPMICGYYGEHNLGDDALLEVLLAQLPKGCDPLVTAHDQQWIQDRFGVATCNRRSLPVVMAKLATCDALVLGGGSLLQDSTSFQSLLYYCLLMLAARLLAKPVALWGQGLGPLRRPLSRALVRCALPLASAITWRDGASATMAQGLGISNQGVGSDPVWGYPTHPWRGKKGPIVLCWRPLLSLDPDGWRQYLAQLATLVQRSGRELVWFPFHRGQDRGLLERLAQASLVPEIVLERSREVTVEEPSEAMALFAEAGLVLAMRLHALILAALAGSPVAALSYDPKVSAVALALGCPLQHLDAPPNPMLATEWLQLLDTPLQQSAVTALRAGTAVHRHQLQKLLA